MTDTTATIAQLRRIVGEFVDCRDWHQFHTPKNLSMSMAIEVAELMEHFQWLTPEQSRAVAEQPERLGEVADEMADVLCYLLAMANELKLDLAAALEAKMVKNAKKDPAEAYRGRVGPNDPNKPADGRSGP